MDDNIGNEYLSLISQCTYAIHALYACLQVMCVHAVCVHRASDM